jgi:hypothetical protein
MSAILDFGVGCGRVARHWNGLSAEVHGCDYNPVLVEWCKANLPHLRAVTNRLDPPLRILMNISILSTPCRYSRT